jgi:thioredoxin reductase (NADPH)
VLAARAGIQHGGASWRHQCNPFSSSAAIVNSGITLDANGFILTGGDRHSLETTRRGVFAIGDVRATSVKRIAAAVGEGAQVVAALRSFLTTASSPTR